MDNLNYLLRELHLLGERFKMQLETEEVFNVFELMMKRTDERNLHSRFISILLDPRASHKVGDAFLKGFLKVTGIDFDYQLDALEVYPNECNRSEYKNIDILLIDRKAKSGVIIENKIYAADSNHESEGQLEKYYRQIIEEGLPPTRISVVYLSLDRRGPSHESVATSNQYPELEAKIINLNYGVHILQWLDECCKECYDKPFVRETIIQYKNLIERMTNSNISHEQINELMAVVGRNRDNLQSTKLLLNNIATLQAASIWMFWKELTERLKENGFEIRKPIAERECEELIFGSSRSRKVDFNLEILWNKEVYLTVNVDYQASLCIGVSENDKAKMEEARLNSFYESKSESLLLEKEEGWSWFRIITFPESFCENTDIFGGDAPTLDFVDYNNDLHLSLLSSNERRRIIDHAADIINAVAVELDGWMKTELS